MKLNGKEKPLTEPLSLEKLLKEEGYVLTRIAVEKNGEIIPKSAYGETTVSDDDTLEVVTFVGGG